MAITDQRRFLTRFENGAILNDYNAARDLSQFQYFVKMCAARSGQLLNLTAIGAVCGLSATTAREWLSVLEASDLHFWRDSMGHEVDVLLAPPKRTASDRNQIGEHLCFRLAQRDPQMAGVGISS